MTSASSFLGDGSADEAAGNDLFGGIDRCLFQRSSQSVCTLRSIYRTSAEKRNHNFTFASSIDHQ